MYRIAQEDPSTPEAVALLDALSEALEAITGSSGRLSFEPNDVRTERSAFVVARDSNGRAVGCGAFRPLHDGIAEVKRMYAAPGTRGVGSAVLGYPEQRAAELAYSALWLETRQVNVRAVRFYEGRGYSRIPNFGKYVGRPDAVCLAKALLPSADA